MNIKKILGVKVKTLRKNKGLTQEYFSELVDINPRQIVRIENGESFPTAENLEKIAKALGVAVEELFHNELYVPQNVMKEKIIQKLDSLIDEQLRVFYYFVMCI
ncbi:MAG: helix-turn-helix domain-containing protein [Heliobacteriaceae bacterium]|jgi:transcriptional regulator with XRE-family HTH domain|nr:helix-turn-helix domain-containing protein [Heliobacteriaceae bacterium]